MKMNEIKDFCKNDKGGIVMKRFFAIAIVVLCIIVTYFGIQFKEIEKVTSERLSAPLLTKRSQVEKLFYDNETRFNETADALAENGQTIHFEYNADIGEEQFSVFEDSNLIEDVKFIVHELGMWHITVEPELKFVEFIQVDPRVFADIQIGVCYGYQQDQRVWLFRYFHDIDCKHKHKLVYKIYDLFYNTGIGMPL